MNGAIANMGSLLSSWFSPTGLFCLLNLVIATIFLSSKLKSPNKHPPQNHSDYYNPHDTPHLARAPSLLHRVRSFNFSFYRSDSSNPFQPETHPTENPVQTQLPRAPSILERVWSNNFSLHRSDSLDPSETVNPEGPVETQLARAPSILERVKSFNFSLYGYDHPDPNHHTRQDNDPGHDHHVMRSKSDSTEGEGEGHVAPEVTMKKSASERRMAEETKEDEERRRPATVRERKHTTASFFGEDEMVDEKADDFISRFKQQLKLQRLDSLKRYTDMLTRGSGR